MTTNRAPQGPRPQQPGLISRIPILNNLKIGRKLTLGFGILVLITLLVVGFSYLGSSRATQKINDTAELRVPTALRSARAQANLLRMLADVRGYLALGDPTFRERYYQDRTAFADDLERLEELSVDFDQQDRESLHELRNTFEELADIPDTLFELRDDQLEREPAYQLMATTGSELAGNVLIAVNSMIESQGEREATSENLALLEDMAKFQGSFASMFSALRGYVTTRNRIFRIEYEGNLAVNQNNWQRIRIKSRLLDANQQTKLAEIETNRQEFLQLPDTIFAIMESDEWRTDLYLFTTETVPRTEKMQQLLNDLTVDQQTDLQRDLNTGRQDLNTANQRTLVAGIAALILGLVLALIFRENIAGPVVRLTNVANQIRAGDLEAQAMVESRDETGTLAETFNNMTNQLRQTLLQVTKEKKRADDLLEVVIPIGVELTAEKDFNRLLENILMEAKSFCRANAGILYLRETDKDNLKFVIVRNDAQNVALGGTTNREIPFAPLPLHDKTGQPNQRNVAAQVALSGNSINIADTKGIEAFDLADPQLDGEQIGYQAATSVLTIPLKNSQERVLGVLQLLDAQDPETGQEVSFDQNLQQMMESLSSLAAAALEAYIREQSLRQQIKQLRIEIDEAKREKQVTEIVETDFFQDLQAKAREIRRRGRRSRRGGSSDPETADT